MKILLTSASFAPDYGGPSVSIPRLAMALQTHGHNVRLWAPDGTAEHLGLDKKKGWEVKPSVQLLEVIDQFSPSVVHDNGIWLPYNHALASICRKRSIPRLVSCRGMLEPYAIDFKPIRKRVAWAVYQRRDLVSASCLHVTSYLEAQNLRRLNLQTPVEMVPNGMDVPDKAMRKLNRDSVDTPRTALFLGRIHPIKGLPMLIEAWACLRPSSWQLIIAGPGELADLKQVQSLLYRFQLNRHIQIVGPKYGMEKQKLLQTADLFVLPTHSESFGMSVAEALAYGIPVLTTKAAPWSCIVDNSCGWWVESDLKSISDALREALSSSPNKLDEMGERGRQLIEREFSWEKVATELSTIYSALSKR